VAKLGLGGGVMVVFGVAVEISYSCGSIAISTRVVIIENERIVKEIAFIFITGVAGGKCDTWGVLHREGGSPSTVATIMVMLLWVWIPTVALIDLSTAEGVGLEISYFPNYTYVQL